MDLGAATVERLTTAGSGGRRLRQIAMAGLLLILLVQAVAWSWKTSGVLQADGSWFKYPWGFTAIAHTPGLGEWPLMKEDFIYLQHHQAFLGVPGEFVRPNSWSEHQRSLYGFLTQGLWFLGPILSGLALNVVIWILAAVSAAYVARVAFPGTAAAEWAAAALVVTGQGFLHSVGEVSPHVLGYATSFFIGAVICAKRLWRGEASGTDHVLTHGLIGVLRLAYESTWLSFPFAFLVTWYSSARRHHRVLSWPTLRLLGACTALSVGPGGLMLAASRVVGGTDFATEGVRMGLTGRSPLALVGEYAWVFADAVLAFGPFVMPLVIAGVVAYVWTRDRAGIALSATLLTAMLGLTFILLGYGARGYASFSLALPMFVLAVRGFLAVWGQRSWLRYAAPALLVGQLLWANAPLAGFRLPLVGFSWGYLVSLDEGHWQSFPQVPLP